MEFSVSDCALFFLLLVSTADATSVYNPATELCCAGTSYLADSRVSSCCGNQLNSDPTNYICCNNILKPKPNPGGFGSSICCGSDAIDTRINVCIKGQTVAIPGPAKADNQTKVCVSLNDYEFYNENEKICCDDTLFDCDPEITSCCEGQPYNFRINKCCNNKLFEVGVDTTFIYCCGDSYMDMRTQKCCHGVPQNLDTSFAHNACCDKQIYDYGKSICCDNTITPREDGSAQSCCGGQFYNSKTQYCCNDEIFDNLDNQFYCCKGKILYERLNKQCCNGEGYDVNATHHVGLVNGQCTFYNNRDQVCCHDGIIDLTAADKAAGRNTCCY